MHVIVESLNNGYKLEWIFVIGFISTILAILTIASKSPIHSVLYLITLFVTISLYLILFDMPFIAISYLLVYVGAISILFLFILMLINVRISELLTEERNSAVLAILVILSFSFVFHDKLSYFIDIYRYISNYIDSFYTSGENIVYSHNIDRLAISNIETNYISLVTSSHWDSHLIEVSHITGIGNILYTTLFQHMTLIASILLLAMVGAIVITVKPSKLNESIKNKIISPDYVNLSPFS